MKVGWRRAAVLGLLPLGGCVYYNAMWSAERFATQARRAEAAGQESEARSYWLRAAVKAESVATRHPRSRWADDALVLRAEALVRGGGCSRAQEALARARALASASALGERVGLAAAECELAAGRPREAAALLGPLLESVDHTRRSRAAFLAGRAAWAQGDGVRAASLLAGSTHAAAPATRVRVLLAAGQAEAGVALLDSLVSRRFVEADWTELLAAVAAGASPAAASGSLDRLLLRGHVPPDAAARLLAADGDRRAAAGDLSAAGARYGAAADLAPDGAMADAARARRLRTLAADAVDSGDVDRLAAALGRLRGAGDQRAFANMLDLIRRPASDAATFRAGEVARDSLRASRLAARLFLEVPARWPGSLFAPKAIIAAMALQPDRGDSLSAVLDARYPASPYTLALRGLPAPGFAAAEDSLARALGFELVVARAPAAAAFPSPWPGPRSVWLEPPPGRAPRPVAPAVGRATRAAPQPGRPAQPPPRPVERP